MATPHRTLIDIPVKTREAMITLLNARLADALDLYVQAKSSHWTVRGANFIALHKLFDEVVAMAEEHADMIAERVGQLGGITQSAVQHVAKKTTLPVFDVTDSNSLDCVTMMAKALAKFSAQCRKAIDEADDKDDKVTADLFTNITRTNDKMLWFVEAHLQ